MLLHIDYRERFFINLLQDNTKQLLQHNIIYNININNVLINIIIRNLDIGDFIISENEIFDGVKIIIERKTIQDLVSSIIDSRFREQKERLLDSIKDSSKILYIIEGKKIPTSISINGAIQNLILKHNYKVLQTENEQDSFDNILLLYKKINNKDFDMCNQNVVSLNLKKKDKINNNIFAHQLNTITGVSMKSALELSDKYKSMKNLISMYDELENELDKELLLYNNPSCKIGKALSKKIYKALH